VAAAATATRRNVYRIDLGVDRPRAGRQPAAAAGLAPAPTVAAARPALARILASCGGWPYATAKPTARVRRAFALRLLGDAFGQVLGPAPQQAPGITLAPARDGMRAITLVTRVEVNLADARHCEPSRACRRARRGDRRGASRRRFPA
jgi:hypothetical protein